MPEILHFSHSLTHTPLELSRYAFTSARRAAGTALKHVIAPTKPQIREGLQEAVEDELVVC